MGTPETDKGSKGKCHQGTVSGSNIGDIQKLLDTNTPGIVGAITGRAIYEGTLDVAEAQALCDLKYKDE